MSSPPACCRPRCSENRKPIILKRAQVSGFWVSSKSGSGSLSGSGSIISPRNTFLGFRVSGFWVSGFLVSGFLGFWFQGFIQIGVGVAIGIGIDHLTAEHFLGFLGFWFLGFWVSGFQGFRVSGFRVSRFHPNRGRDRYRDRDRYSLTVSQSHSLTASPPLRLRAPPAISIRCGGDRDKTQLRERTPMLPQGRFRTRDQLVDTHHAFVPQPRTHVTPD